MTFLLIICNTELIEQFYSKSTVHMYVYVRMLNLHNILLLKYNKE